MVFDVMIRENFTNNGKQVVNVVRVHDRILSQYLRQVQDNGKYIISVIPLFRPKTKDVILKHIKEDDYSREVREQKDKFDNPNTFIEHNMEALNSGEMYMKSMRLTLDTVKKEDFDSTDFDGF